jgi:hypothetical protein
MNFNEIILNYQALDSLNNIVNLQATFTLPLAGLFLFVKVALGLWVMISVAKLWK